MPPITAQGIDAVLAPLTGLTRLSFQIGDTGAEDGFTCFPAAVCGMTRLEHLDLLGGYFLELTHCDLLRVP